MKYTVTLTGTANYTTDVEADSPEQAVERAQEDAPALCVHCTSPHSGAYAELGDDWRAVAVYDGHSPGGDPIGVQVLGVFDREDDARMVRGAERVEAHRLRTGPPACTAAYRIRWRTWRPDGPAEPPYSIPNPWPHSFEAVEPVAFDVHWESHGLPGYLLQVTGPDEDAVRELYEQERAAYERGAWRVQGEG